MKQIPKEPDWLWPKNDTELSLQEVELLTTWIRHSDPIQGWPIEQRLERVRSKIMSAIEDGSAFSPQFDTNNSLTF